MRKNWLRSHLRNFFNSNHSSKTREQCETKEGIVFELFLPNLGWKVELFEKDAEFFCWISSVQFIQDVLSHQSIANRVDCRWPTSDTSFIIGSLPLANSFWSLELDQQFIYFWFYWKKMPVVDIRSLIQRKKLLWI